MLAGDEPNSQASMIGLQEFAPNIWIVDGPIVFDTGFAFTTRMTVVKLSDGALWVSSPVPSPFETLEQITKLGPVRYLVAATPRHVWRLEAWHTLFPEAQLWAARNTPMTLKPAHLPLTGVLSDQPPAAWADDLEQLVFKGNPLLSEVIFYHRRAKTAMLDDILQVDPPMAGRPLQNAMARFGGVAAPHGGVPLDMRWTFVNRRLARQSLEQVLAWDFDKLIIAHGDCIEKEAKPFIRRCFRWLTN
ncbi:MAG: DUF4336 domain-containing protein [Anaerolineales bacterium]|nr:DUF4336 domain-containing protein [Anaerolineales bacterium]